MFIKNNLMNYVEGVEKKFNDTVIVYMSSNIAVYGTYIAPRNSTYFDDQFDILDTHTVNSKEDGRKWIICGDLNSRMGCLKELNGFAYTDNIDTEINQHGRQLLNICRENRLVPLNMLKHGRTQFPSDFTFKKGNVKSQNDWILVSKNTIKNVSNFCLVGELADISDHTPVAAELSFDSSGSWSQLNDSIDAMVNERNNHSRVKKFKMENLDLRVFTNVMDTYINELTDTFIGKDDINGEELAGVLEESLQKSAKIATTKNQQIYQPEEDDNLKDSLSKDAKKEYAEWNNVLAERNPKRLWEKIDYNGKKKKNTISPENTCDEFAEFLEARCSLPYEHSSYDGIKSDIFDAEMDGMITAEETLYAAKGLNKKSMSRCGIPVGALLSVLNPILGLLVTMLNAVFTGTYPKTWAPFIVCLPKKGKLNIPFVRGINLKQLLAKLYDAILKNRLVKWLKIPIEQTAYQKFKGCYLHVFFVRCLVAICKKRKKPIFIGVTDFEAAFDLISRRNLFKKLVNLGIGMFLLKAIMEMYKVTDAYVLLDGEYSRRLSITAGVLQGSASSTLLFMAYTSDIIKIFKSFFPIEEIIHEYHILLHADDSLILATSMRSLVAKFKKLCEYCRENNIRLQLSKCSFLAINSNEKGNIELEDGTIKNAEESVYLGSTITDSGNVTNDIKAEIKSKEKTLNKFMAYVTQNKNAPLVVKEKILEACLVSILNNNCETWGDANLDGMEKKYRRAMKYMLGVKSSTCNEFPYIELGKPTLKSLVHRRQLKFFRDCTIHKDWPMQRFIIRLGIDARCSFVDHYVQLDLKYENLDDITKQSLTEIQDTVRRKAENQSKYKSYMLINPLLERPSVYNRFIPTYKLHYASQLRCISHELEIEIGRYSRTPREERLCSCGEVEDEEHFILYCHQYTHIRNKYFNENATYHERLDHWETPNFLNEMWATRRLCRQR